MATVRIHHLQARVTSRAEATKIIEKVTYQILFRAKLASYGPYSKGNLARSLEREIRQMLNGVRGRVGSKLPCAASVQSGAKPHTFGPHRPPHALAFYWRKVGMHVILDHVNHPGQRGKHYLTSSLAEIARVNGMRYVIYER